MPNPTRFSGYASVFDMPDAGGDVVRRGAFALPPPHPVPLLWQQDAAPPIGTDPSCHVRDEGVHRGRPRPFVQRDSTLSAT